MKLYITTEQPLNVKWICLIDKGGELFRYKWAEIEQWSTLSKEYIIHKGLAIGGKRRKILKQPLVMRHF